jgi:hypothetical protein
VNPRRVLLWRLDRGAARDKPSIAPDYVISALLFGLGCAVAIAFLREVGYTFFYQTQMTSAVMAACDRGFVEPATMPPSLLDFVFMRTPVFDCSQLSSVTTTLPSGGLADRHLYLIAAVAGLWRSFGVRYQSLAPLLALLHGAYVVAGFCLGRLFLARWISALLGIILAVSPIAVSMLFFLRDYAKAPFILWAAVLLVLALRERRPWHLALVGAVLGAVIGVGSGFRSDVIIMLPLAFVILILGSSSRGIVTARFVAPLSMSVVAAALIAPLNFANGGGGFLFMEGMTEAFRLHLGLSPAVYDLGTAYSDELTLSSIVSELRKSDPVRFDAGEPSPFEGVSQGLVRSTEYVGRWLPFFLGDVATRAVKSVSLIAGFPSLLSLKQRSLDPYRLFYPTPTFVAKVTARLWALMPWPWTSVVGGIGLLVLGLRIFARSRREAASVGALFLVFMAYPSFQFSVRHLFHLEAIFWLGVLSLFARPATYASLKPHWRPYAAWLGGLTALAGGSYAALLFIQDGLLRPEIRDLLSGERQTIAAVVVELPSADRLVKVPVPDRYQSLVESLPDGLSLPIALTVPPFAVRASADRLLLEIGGEDCPSEPFDLGVVYKTQKHVWQPFDRSIRIPARGSSESVVVITPAFYRPTQYLDGFVLPKTYSNCMTAIYRLVRPSPLPTLFTAVLPPTWERDPLHISLWSP